MKKLADAWLPTRWGRFKIVTFGKSKEQYSPHIALVHEDFDPEKTITIRMHSECLTGDVFSSLRCDCGEQLHRSLEIIARDGGVLIYLRQEGRGIGISHKLDAYELQDKGLNTLEANVHLGFEPDERDYNDAVQILKDLGISQIRLLTNNPEKLEALKRQEIKVVERVPLMSESNSENEKYLEAKKKWMGHLFDS